MDVFENGALDFMISYTIETKKTKIAGVQVLKNEYNIDSAFLKVAGTVNFSRFLLFMITGENFSET